MTRFQCSHCFEIYDFNDYLKLKTEPMDANEPKKYGSTAICKCGKPFHKNKWQLRTNVDGYIISTTHLEIEHGGMKVDELDGYWYETMIFQSKELKKNIDQPALSFQARYKTQKEAIAGHKLTIELLPKIILNPDKYPQSIISLFCGSFGNKGSYNPNE